MVVKLWGALGAQFESQAGGGVGGADFVRAEVWEEQVKYLLLLLEMPDRNGHKVETQNTLAPHKVLCS